MSAGRLPPRPYDQDANAAHSPVTPSSVAVELQVVMTGNAKVVTAGAATDRSFQVFAFAERGKLASIPGPLIRVAVGTELRLRCTIGLIAQWWCTGRTTTMLRRTP